MAEFSMNIAATLEKLQRLADPDPTPVLEAWERVIDEDNTKGILAGTDKDDQPLKPVTYRPQVKVKRVTKNQRNNTRGEVSGFGPLAAGLHNNLPYADYLALGGPPTAPRGKDSRVITNLVTGHGRDPAADDRWFAAGAWQEVVDVRGEPFLERMFRTRNLAGLRQWGRNRAVEVLKDWVRDLLR
jgi:hypothetical protein